VEHDPVPEEADAFALLRLKQDRDIEEARRLWRAAAVAEVPAPPADVPATRGEELETPAVGEAHSVTGFGIALQAGEQNPFRLIERGPGGAVLPTALFFATGIGFVLVDRPRPAEYPRRPGPPLDNPRKR
jgi:hypothetical protein